MTAIEIDLASSVYDRLRNIAMVRGETVTDILTTAAYRMSRMDLATDEVAVMWVQGMTDKQMAANLGWTNARVAVHRRSLELSANKPRTKRKKAGNR